MSINKADCNTARGAGWNPSRYPRNRHLNFRAYTLVSPRCADIAHLYITAVHHFEQACAQPASALRDEDRTGGGVRLKSLGEGKGRTSG